MIIENGVRDVTARYASDFMKPDFRRRRTDPTWIAATLRKKLIRANRERAKYEDSYFRVELVAKPLPTLISEYKNHPLYVLEKDLLKFEGIYPQPENQKPLGEIRGHKVYPRSTVYTLQSAKNWEKLARSVKVIFLKLLLYNRILLLIYVFASV
uniref:BHD_1 domain-containing protein n=1 Tax=Heterorhabditis bacteriophora TaxID=37862 RepID=A0A1I7X6Y3_HETBA